MALKSAATLRLEPGLRQRLERLAKARNRSSISVGNEAVRAFLDANDWQIAEIHKAVEEADRGEFASSEEVHRVLSKYRK